MVIAHASVEVLDKATMQGLMRDEQFLGTIVVVGSEGLQQLDIYHGARIMITDSLGKENGFVKGALGTVMMLSRVCLVVKLDCGSEAAIHKIAYNNDVGSYSVAFPVVHGYATTLAKTQGHHHNRFGSLARSLRASCRLCGVQAETFSDVPDRQKINNRHTQMKCFDLAQLTSLVHITA